MPSDPNDELAQFRSRRDRARRPADPGAADATPSSTEQDDALARARESWTLSQLGRDVNAQRQGDEGGRGGPGEEAHEVPGEDD